MRLSPKFLISFLLVLQGLLLVGWFLVPKKPVVRLVNLNTIQGQFIRQLAERKVSDEQAMRATLEFKAKLQDTLRHFATLNNAILIDSQTVIAGGVEVTDDIARDLSRAMRKKL
jgi:type-F conjugative transfer system protein TrbI